MVLSCDNLKVQKFYNKKWPDQLQHKNINLFIFKNIKFKFNSKMFTTKFIVSIAK